MNLAICLAAKKVRFRGWHLSKKRILPRRRNQCGGAPLATPGRRLMDVMMNRRARSSSFPRRAGGTRQLLVGFFVPGKLRPEADADERGGDLAHRPALGTHRREVVTQHVG